MTGYALLGGGRLARHFRHYLSLLDLPATGWARDRSNPLNSSLAADAGERLRLVTAMASHVLLLVSDGAIGSLLRRYPFLHEKTLVHCCGALSFPNVAGAHPLMTFGPELYSLGEYREVPFMVETGYDMTAILPGLPNPAFPIAVKDKAAYHALCVAAGNFPQILWRAAGQRFERLGLKPDTLKLYLQRALQNFLASPSEALTGPLARGDVATVERNLASLRDDALQDLYRAFIRFHQAESHAEARQEVAR